MSHIAKIDTKIKDLANLKKALTALGIQYVEAEEGQRLTLKGYGKNEVISDCIMEIKTGSSYSIGVRQKGKGYEIAADWWAIETFTEQKQEDIMNRITRQYAYETVMDKIKTMGYNIVQEEQDVKENLRITVRRWD
jgi:deoxyxylulose-5-phosphate synthase